MYRTERFFVVCGTVVLLLVLSGMAQALTVSGTINDNSYQRWDSVYFDPINTPVTISGQVDLSNLGSGGVVTIGLVDKQHYDSPDSVFWGGAYTYFGKRTNLDIGPSDGWLGGEMIQNFQGVPISTNIVYFQTIIDNDSIDVQFSLDGVTYSSIISDTYGDIKDFNSTTAFSWDEFQYGAYLGIECWDGKGGSVNYTITATPPVPAPEPASICALFLLAGGVAAMKARKRR